MHNYSLIDISTCFCSPYFFDISKCLSAMIPLLTQWFFNLSICLLYSDPVVYHLLTVIIYSIIFSDISFGLQWLLINKIYYSQLRFYLPEYWYICSFVLPDILCLSYVTKDYKVQRDRFLILCYSMISNNLIGTTNPCCGQYVPSIQIS